MDRDKLKELVKSLSIENKKEMLQEIYNSLDNVRNSIQSSMEPVYKAVEPIAEAVSNFNQSVIEPFIKSESFQNTVNSILSWFRNIDWQKVSETYNLNALFCNEIKEQLQTKNIDTAILSPFNLSQLAELYITSNQCGLMFVDLIEDNIQLFGNFEYEKAQTYLNIITKRKAQSLDNAPKALNIDSSYVENLKYSEKNIRELIELALRDYDKSNISLNDQEKKLLTSLKQNSFLENKDIARILELQLPEVETLCETIRKKLNIDYFEDDNVKRQLLISMAKNITLK